MLADAIAYEWDTPPAASDGSLRPIEVGWKILSYEVSASASTAREVQTGRER